MILCKEIRKVKGGWIVEARWPYGDNPSGYGEVVCVTWEDVIKLITACRGDEGWRS